MNNIELINNITNNYCLDDIISPNNSESINIIWSGGCDSTLLLHRLFKLLKNKNINKIVNSYSFNHPQLSGKKQDMERFYRNMYISYAKNNGICNSFNPIEINLKGNIEVGNKWCAQPAMWMSVISELRDDSILISGYHRGDDFFMAPVWLDWANLFLGLTGLYGKKNIKFVTPLIFETKDDIIKELISEDIYDFTWHCENPSFDFFPCNSCIPCATHQSAALYLAKKNNIIEKTVHDTILKLKEKFKVKESI